MKRIKSTKEMLTASIEILNKLMGDEIEIGEAEVYLKILQCHLEIFKQRLEIAKLQNELPDPQSPGIY